MRKLHAGFSACEPLVNLHNKYSNTSLNSVFVGSLKFKFGSATRFPVEFEEPIK